MGCDAPRVVPPFGKLRRLPRYGRPGANRPIGSGSVSTISYGNTEGNDFLEGGSPITRHSGDSRNPEGLPPWKSAMEKGTWIPAFAGTTVLLQPWQPDQRAESQEAITPVGIPECWTNRQHWAILGPTQQGFQIRNLTLQYLSLPIQRIRPSAQQFKIRLQSVGPWTASSCLTLPTRLT